MHDRTTQRREHGWQMLQIMIVFYNVSRTTVYNRGERGRLPDELGRTQADDLVNNINEADNQITSS